MNGFQTVRDARGERIVNGWRYESLEQARAVFAKHLIAWFPEADGGETIRTLPDLRTRGAGRLQVRSAGRVTEIEFIDLVPIRRTTAPSDSAGPGARIA
ncbi:MAG TPA: hypothetical protein VM597_38605 [Gemmataceae bacterium]|jgi:hypothetical protein|nr:hypothetical protein [Gemmataceae bacterium]